MRDLKAMAAQLGVVPSGDKRCKKTWIDAIRARQASTHAIVTPQPGPVSRVEIRSELSNLERTRMQDLKALAARLGVVPAGDKRYKKTWIDGIKAKLTATEEKAPNVRVAAEEEEVKDKPAPVTSTPPRSFDDGGSQTKQPKTNDSPLVAAAVADEISRGFALIRDSFEAAIHALIDSPPDADLIEVSVVADHGVQQKQHDAAPGGGTHGVADEISRGFTRIRDSFERYLF